jgi:hypothetical protein
MLWNVFTLRNTPHVLESDNSRIVLVRQQLRLHTPLLRSAVETMDTSIWTTLPTNIKDAVTIITLGDYCLLPFVQRVTRLLIASGPVKPKVDYETS